MSNIKFYCDNLHASAQLGPCMFCEKMAIWPELMCDLLDKQIYDDFAQSKFTGLGTHEDMDPVELIKNLRNGDRSDNCRWVVNLVMEDGTAGSMLRLGIDLYPQVRRSEWEDLWDEVLDQMER